ncbi:Rne/Rng family ribonuclease, partial [Roseitranquillus sediminis]|uniref:Rne/Rng family ribonuclease n=1 Tax=Roseitranquillus sediminis TaxID=2809051 RepID=UPI001D0C622B
MAKKMLIDATHAEETRVVVVDGNKVEDFDFESENKRQLAGNIYLAKVTRVEPSLQAAFIEYGGNRHGFLAFSEIHPDYYQIPVADREALLAEEAAFAAQDEEAESQAQGRRRRRGKSADAGGKDAVSVELPAESGGEADEEARARTAAVVADIPGMNIVDLDEDTSEDASDNSSDDDDGREPYRAMDDAASRDEEIESVADDDASDDIRPKRKQRPRRYKIQEVIKVRQIMLVQVVKEERGNKGAALTTYLSLAGRYCVLMPNTARGGGISRKITNVADRKKLKQIASEIDVPKGAGLIIRTAGSQRTKTEIKRDYEYLQRLWEQIRELTLKSIAPTKIYEEGDLIKRSIRDLYSRDIDEVLVEGAEGYKTAKAFMKMIMPSHAKNVKLYADSLPLFARFQVESYLASMFNPTVQLKSGGYIVIGVTEALVAIDVNSGRSTKEGSIEDTALKTNLEAAEEIARQLRLRDLAGLIVVDFIDMEERKNNAAVEKRFKDSLKSDRARIQVGRISGFGLLEMSRQRLRPGMIEATTQPCPACHGTGLLRSDDSLALMILRQLEEEGTRGKSREVLVRTPVAISNYIMNQKREHVAGIEARYGLAVRVEGDPTLVSPDFKVEKFKTPQTRVVEATAPVVSADAALMSEIDEDDVSEETPEDVPEDTGEAEPAASDDQQPKKKRRRRRRRRSGNGSAETSAERAETEAAAPAEERAPESAVEEESQAPKKRSRSRSRKRTEQSNADAPEQVEANADPVAEQAVPVGSAADSTTLVPEVRPAEQAATEQSEMTREPTPEQAQRVRADGEDRSEPLSAESRSEAHPQAAEQFAPQTDEQVGAKAEQ